MKTLFAVTRTRGPAWDPGRPMREQARWPAHAHFMNELAACGFVRLGGPLGEGEEVLLVVSAPDEETIRSTLARDPWSESDLLRLGRVQRWRILLDAAEAHS